MRHKNISRHFGRTSAHRKAMFMNLSKSLVKYEIIKTTLAKAKELRRFIEPLITKSKVDTLANKRFVFKKINDKKIIYKLFFILGKRYKNRPGGYIRILKYKYRAGDAAPLALVELVDRKNI